MTAKHERAWKQFDEAVRDPATIDRARSLARALPLGAITQHGRSTLHSAAMAGAESIALELLAAGADPLLEDADRRTPLQNAAMSGSPAVLRAMLAREASADLTQALREALAGLRVHKHAAAHPAQAIEALEVLLDAGADARHVDAPFSGPLARGAGRVLLAAGIAPAWHARVLDVFVARGVTLDEIFDTTTLAEDPLCVVAQAQSDSTLLEYLIAAGASIEGLDGRGTILHGLAARDAEPAELARWIQRGARIDARDGLGRTPLLTAAAAGAATSTIALLDLGASAVALDGEGRNAATLAAARLGSEALVARLRERGVTPQRDTPVAPGGGPPRAAIPAGAKPARVHAGSFKNFDAWVTARDDGRYDAVVLMFGRGVKATLEASEIRLLDR